MKKTGKKDGWMEEFVEDSRYDLRRGHAKGPAHPSASSFSSHSRIPLRHLHTHRRTPSIPRKSLYIQLTHKNTHARYRSSSASLPSK